jgi:hypothetical protein
MPFYTLSSNPQIIRGNMKNWKITRYGYASKVREDTRINNEIRISCLSFMRAMSIYRFLFVSLPTYDRLSPSILTALFLIVKAPNKLLQKKGE